ncbi:MAG TPA: hypothetical protein VGK57_15130, partial [Candidatus Binatia bacterium]
VTAGWKSTQNMGARLDSFAERLPRELRGAIRSSLSRALFSSATHFKTRPAPTRRNHDTQQ